MLFLAVVSVAVLTGCGQKSGADRVERSVLDHSVYNYVPRVEAVSCKNSISGSVGDTSMALYDCEGRTGAGSRLFFYCSVFGGSDGIGCFRTDGPRGDEDE
jgi:hypothetical protein